MDIFCNKEVEHFTFQQPTKTTTFFAGVRVAGKVFLLQTVTNRQKIPLSPFCSKCSRQSCIHWVIYKKIDKKEFRFNHHLGDEHNTDENDDEIDLENIEDEQDEVDLDNVEEGIHWRSEPSV